MGYARGRGSYFLNNFTDVKKELYFFQDSYGYFRGIGLSFLRRFYRPYHSLDVRPLDYIKRLVDQGQLQPVLDSSNSLNDFDEAFHATAAGANIGKAVVTFNSK